MASKYQFVVHNKDFVDKGIRLKVAKQIYTIILDFLGTVQTRQSKLLDIGCYDGTITKMLSRYFKNTVGIDLDASAVSQAKKMKEEGNLDFKSMDATHLSFPAENFDVIICNHVYYYVDDPKKLLSEIYRVLKPGGICYLSGRNRFSFWDSHLELPFISFLPNFMVSVISKLTGRSNESVRSYLYIPELRKLCSEFKIHSYTGKIIRNPFRFGARSLSHFGFITKNISLKLIDRLELFSPTFVWILEKRPVQDSFERGFDS